jgi:hypothetical protein
MTEGKIQFDYATMPAKDRVEIWPVVRRYLDNPADAILTESMQAGYYDEDWRRARHKRRLAKAALNAEMRGAHSR